MHAIARMNGSSRAPFAFKDSVIEWFCNWYQLSHFAAFFNEIRSQVIHRDTLWEPCYTETLIRLVVTLQRQEDWCKHQSSDCCFGENTLSEGHCTSSWLLSYFGKWSSCRFTYSYLVTTFASSIEEISVNFGTGETPIHPITCIAPSSETTTGGSGHYRTYFTHV